jgi:hypothetical protein
MQNKGNIKAIEDKVVIKLFEKFTKNPDGLTYFIDLLAKESGEADVAKFKKRVSGSIAAKNRMRFAIMVRRIKLDEASLQKINGLLSDIEGPASRTTGAAAAAAAEEPEDMAEYSGALYDDLVFIVGLSPNLKQLGFAGEERVDSIHANLFSKKAGKFTARNYAGICDRIKKGLVDCAKKDLFPDELDKKKIAMTFSTSLTSQLVSMGVTTHVKDKVIDSLRKLNAEISPPDRIRHMMLRQELARPEDLDIIPNTATSASDTYIVTNKSNGERWYAKSFDGEMSDGGKLSPNEMFLYKVMEYVGYGPKAKFLVHSGSSTGGSVGIYKGNFILTEDVAVDGQEFFLDKEKHEGNMKIFADHNPREFAIEVSAASLLTDIFSVYDAFGQNTGNYGIVGDPTGPSKYRLQFVDHQARPENESFLLNPDDRLSYSPRLSFFRKADQFHNKQLPPLARLALQGKSHGITKESIRGEVCQRLFCEQDNGQSMLENAISQARNDVETLVLDAETNFMANPMEKLDAYIAKIHEKIAAYHGPTASDSKKPDGEGSERPGMGGGGGGR